MHFLLTLYQQKGWYVNEVSADKKMIFDLAKHYTNEMFYK